MPISVTSTRVSGSSRSTVSGRPSSLLRLASAATVGVTAAQSAASASFVVVLPVEPTTATTCASERSRTSRASDASAASWSRGTSVAAPRARASSTNSVPVFSATNRSPARASRESSWTRRTTPSAGAPRSSPSERPRPRASRAESPALPIARDNACVESTQALSTDAPPPSSVRSAARATSRSSNGCTTPPMSCPCS